MPRGEHYRLRDVKFPFPRIVGVEQLMGHGVILTELLIKEKAQEFA